jgi:hypothetical protein
VAELPQIQMMARRVGIFIRSAEFRTPAWGPPSLRVMLDDQATNRRLLHFWPATGLTIQGHHTATGRRGLRRRRACRE